jgi:hypothetical protein
MNTMSKLRIAKKAERMFQALEDLDTARKAYDLHPFPKEDPHRLISAFRRVAELMAREVENDSTPPTPDGKP